MTLLNEPTVDPKAAIRAARWKEFRSFSRRFFRNPLGVVGLAIVVLLILVAVQLSYELSRHEARIRRLAEEVALLDEAIKALKDDRDGR